MSTQILARSFKYRDSSVEYDLYSYVYTKVKNHLVERAKKCETHLLNATFAIV